MMLFTWNAFSQAPVKNGFLRSTFTVEKIKMAKVIDELIENLPPDYDVVFYRLSLAGKDLQKMDWKPDNEKNVLNSTFQFIEAGQRIYIEYIEVKRRGRDSKPVHIQPRELIVIE